MAKFTHTEFDRAAEMLAVSADSKHVFLNGKRTVMLSMASAQVRIEAEGKEPASYRSKRAVIQAPHGAKVLPYFKRHDQWFVVMVEQFRIALPGQLLEAAGGEADTSNIAGEMSRELNEETRIAVAGDDIELVYEAYIQPSMMAAKAYGGIVEINELELPKELMGGEHQFGEYTVLTVKPLVPLLRQRDVYQLTFDLETWLLLDAVAQAAGLVKRLY